MSATTPADLLTLIDAYAAASAHRAESVECASWAFLGAHRAMIAARTAVADALGAVPPPLTDELTRLAEGAAEREQAWRDRIDAALTEAGR